MTSLLQSLFGIQSKTIRLDPFTVIAKLAILSYLPEGTKIGFNDTDIVFYPTNALQGIARFAYGDKRTDIHNLLLPIYWACKWYSSNISMNKMFERATVGLEKLKVIYNDNQIITQCLHYYILVINGYMEVTNVNSNIKNELDAFALTNSGSGEAEGGAFSVFHGFWTAEEVQIVTSLFEYLTKYNDKSQLMKTQQCIELFLSIKHL